MPEKNYVPDVAESIDKSLVEVGLKMLEYLDQPTYQYLRSWLQVMNDCIGKGEDLITWDCPLGDAMLQHAIVKEIVRRGWAYQLSISFQGTHYGKIITRGPDGIKLFHPDAAGSSPAAAILRCYIHALQAMHRAKGLSVDPTLYHFYKAPGGR